MEGGNALAGKTFVVTGAGSGIGQAIALACAAQGASLCLAGRSLSKLQKTAGLIALSRPSARSITVEADISSETDVARMYATALDEFGSLTGIVANAGIMAPSPPVHQLMEDEWRRQIDVNLMGTVSTVAQGGRILVRQGRGGTILATGSSLVFRPGSAMSAYVTSKAAIHSFMGAAALDLAPHRIRVNTLVPGTSDTPPLRQMGGFLEQAAANVPLGEVVSPDELGRFAAFLLSDAVPHMTGAALLVDSGRTLG